jgi:hypothetical protein
MKMTVVPMTLREANDFVEQFHRHHGPTPARGGRFAIGASDGENLLGVAIVGRPVARLLNDSFTAEVTRCCVHPKAPKNVGSFLYGRAWRAWQALGGRRLVTYTLKHESGASLRGAGWRLIGEAKARSQGWDNRPGRTWNPVYGQQKLRWEASQ